MSISFDIILLAFERTTDMREWRNRQTRTFEGRVVIPYGFKSRLSHQNRVITFVIALFFCYDFDGTWTREGLSVKKTVRWTVFSEEREAGTVAKQRSPRMQDLRSKAVSRLSHQK